jgi:iron(III) transport system ATP-binding protein
MAGRRSSFRLFSSIKLMSKRGANMDIIRVEGLAKSYDGHQVLKDLTLSIKKGECFTLLGPSGCGKTVLLRLIAGFETPDAGRILIDDQVVSDPAAGINVSPDIRGIGVVFQDYAVWPHMSVFDNVGFPLKIAKRPANELKDRVMETLELVGMANLAHRLPSELSGGQQQRVALARAIVANSSLMLLDEPLTNLDANLREEMRFEIKELQRKLNITVLYVTHDQEIALALSDRMAIMDNEGHIRQIGNPWEIFEQPVDSFVFNFMGIANFMPVRQVDGAYRVGHGEQIIPWEAPQGNAANWVAGFRPSDVQLAQQGSGLRGTVKRASFLGSMIDYLIEIDGAHLRTSVETHEAMSKGLMFKEEETCAISFRDLHWFDADSLAEVKKQ